MEVFEVTEDQRPVLKTIKNSTEQFIQSSLKPSAKLRVKTLEKFGFSEKERKDPIYKRQLAVLREDDLSGKIFSSDMWSTPLHYTNMKSAGLSEPRNELINFCFRANAGIGTKLFKVLESKTNRNQQHQIEGKIRNMQKLWGYDQEEYNKVTNKLKRKYVKVILNKRGHDIDLTSANPGSGGKSMAKHGKNTRNQSDQDRLDNIMKDLTSLHKQTKKQKKYVSYYEGNTRTNY